MADPDLNTVIGTYESCPKPVVAAIHGTALGGGLELALGCHYRVAAADAQVGLPEVKLGILPGAGGTQRLPRLIGAKPALDMIVSGNFVKAPKARELGIVDEVADGDLRTGAIAYAQKLVADKAPLRRIREMDVEAPPALFDEMRKGLKKKARGFLSPFKCVDAVEIACTTPFEEGMKKERELFTELVASPQSRGQRHIFFAERAAAKVPDIGKDVTPRAIRKAAVIGAGTMGGGIAMNFANAGIPVTVLEVTQDGLDRGMGIIRGNYEASAKKGRMSAEQVDQRMGLISGTLEYGDLGDADIVIEAVFEEMDLKREVFGKLDAVCKPDAILATNTSTLDVDEIAQATRRPEAVIGTHFFSPANVMQLLEVVRGAKTAKDVVATTMSLGRRIRKVPVCVGVCEGFVGNRMLHSYLREAQFLLEEGALPQQVDRVIYDFGLPMGPFAMMDLAGNDVGWRIRKGKEATRDKSLRYSHIADWLCEQGRFGQKTGAGWYRYEDGSRTPVPDPEVEALIVKASEEAGIERRDISDDEILKRCMYPLINEGAQILDEGIAQRSSDIDVIYVYGYGFPPYRGGPMFWAEEVGLKSIHEDVARYHEQHGAFWKPAPLLARLAEEGRSFGDL